MAPPTAADLVATAMQLPAEARSRIIRELIERLDDEPEDEGSEAAWQLEIEMRAREVLSGKSVVEDSTLFRRLRTELSSRRGEPPAD